MPDERAQGGPSITQITELLRQADRLGLTWGRRPGTVQSTTGLFTTTQASVIMDGDDVGITVVSLIGPLVVGDRVMVDRVPPAGLYAMALLDDNGGPFTVSDTSNSGVIIGETVSLTITDAVLRVGVAYELVAGAVVEAASLTPVRYQLRKGSTVAGTLWATGPTYPGMGVIGAFAEWIGYVTPTTDLTTDVSLTITSALAGATHIGNASTPRFLMLRRVGAAVSYPQAVLVS